MQYYPQYTLQHVYTHSFNKGGLTHGQFQTLFEEGVKRESNSLRFRAAINGIDLDKAVSKKSSATIHQDERPKQEEFLFKHPSEYDKMTQEEKEVETQRIMGKLKGFFGNKDNLVGM